MRRIKCFMVKQIGRKRVNHPRKWKRVDTSEVYDSLNEVPVGAMWFAPWMDDLFKPQLEHVLVVKTPGGDWVIDSEANNCTMPNKPIGGTTNTYKRYQEDHHCWILHGTPPRITVNKNGVTCNAGAGSIAQGNKYHGFLRNGYLED